MAATTIEKFTSYRVSGNTFAFRDEIKGLGGRWDKPSKTWIVEVGGMNSVGRARYVLEKLARSGCVIEKLG